MSNPSGTKIIAMWSGPRNLSTAMMRSFSQRKDTIVWDEPFYAAYLRKTGIEHPMREEIIDDGIDGYPAVVKACLKKPVNHRFFYQKHMTQHMIEGVDLTWIDNLNNAFLIRSPERVLASYAKKRAEVVAADLGYGVQREMFERIADKTGKAPIVIDSNDILKSPEGALKRLCDALEIPFDANMLSWEAGPSQHDGIWAAHWYDAIWKSTGFAPPESASPELPEHLKPIADQVADDYAVLKRHKLLVD